MLTSLSLRGVISLRRRQSHSEAQHRSIEKTMGERVRGKRQRDRLFLAPLPSFSRFTSYLIRLRSYASFQIVGSTSNDNCAICGLTEMLGKCTGTEFSLACEQQTYFRSSLSEGEKRRPEIRLLFAG